MLKNKFIVVFSFLIGAGATVFVQIIPGLLSYADNIRMGGIKAEQVTLADKKNSVEEQKMRRESEVIDTEALSVKEVKQVILQHESAGKRNKNMPAEMQDNKPKSDEKENSNVKLSDFEQVVNEDANVNEVKQVILQQEPSEMVGNKSDETKISNLKLYDSEQIVNEGDDVIGDILTEQSTLADKKNRVEEQKMHREPKVINTEALSEQDNMQKMLIHDSAEKIKGMSLKLEDNKPDEAEISNVERLDSEQVVNKHDATEESLLIKNSAPVDKKNSVEEKITRESPEVINTEALSEQKKTQVILKPGTSELNLTNNVDASLLKQKPERNAFALGYYYGGLLANDLSKMTSAGVEFNIEMVLNGFVQKLENKSTPEENEISFMQEELQDEFILKSKPLFRKSKKIMSDLAQKKGGVITDSDDVFVVLNKGADNDKKDTVNVEVTLRKIDSDIIYNYTKNVKKNDNENNEIIKLALKHTGVGGEIEYYTLGKTLELEMPSLGINPWDVILYNIKLIK